MFTKVLVNMQQTLFTSQRVQQRLTSQWDILWLNLCDQWMNIFNAIIGSVDPTIGFITIETKNKLNSGNLSPLMSGVLISFIYTGLPFHFNLGFTHKPWTSIDSRIPQEADKLAKPHQPLA